MVEIRKEDLTCHDLPPFKWYYITYKVGSGIIKKKMWATPCSVCGLDFTEREISEKELANLLLITSGRVPGYQVLEILDYEDDNDIDFYLSNSR